LDKQLVPEIVRREIGDFKWPNGYQCAAAIVFDVDASALEYRYMGTNLSGSYSVGDYGPKVGLPRLTTLLDKHNIKGSFYFPGWVAERFPQRVKEIYDCGHDVGGHMYEHESSNELNHDQLIAIYKKTQKIISDITGIPTRGFKTVGSNWAPETVREMNRLGWRYSCSTAKTCFPSKMKLDGEEIDLIVIPLYWILDDIRFWWGGIMSGIFGSGPPFHIAQSSLQDSIDIHQAEFDSIYQLGGLFVHGYHPRAVGRPSRIRALGKILSYMKQYPDVWFAPVSKIADWVLDGKFEE